MLKRRILHISLTFILLFASCTRNTSVNYTETVVNEEILIQSDPVPDPLRIRAAEIVSLMDNHTLAAQVLITGIDGRETIPPHMRNLLRDSPAGGIMLFRINLNTENNNIRNLINQAVSIIKDVNGIAPFIAVDHEGGTVNRFRSGIISLPPASTYWDLFEEEGSDIALAKIKADSFRAGTVLNELGFNINFAPIAEYLIDENYEFLKSRSYGPDPVFTSQAASAFVQGMERAGILCVPKHFPGSAGPDPHFSLSVLTKDRASLNKLVSPFTFLINNGIRALMTSHTVVLAMDSKIASLSPVVMQNWLRDELKFSGIIISDDFNMNAAGGMRPENAAIQSVAAGADMVLVWQSDLRLTHRAFIAALEDGRLKRSRLEEAVQRIIYEKLKMGI